MIDLITKSVGSIINAIQQTAVASVRSLQKNVFAVEIKNKTKVQEVSGTVKVDQSGTERNLSSLNVMANRIREAINSLKFPTKMEVVNFPKPEAFPEFPKEIGVNNFPKPEAFPKEFMVSNQPTKELGSLNISMEKLAAEIKKLKLDPKINVSTPAPVVVPAPSVTVTQQEIDYEKLAQSILDGQVEIDYEKLAKLIGDEVGGRMVTTGGGSTGAYAYPDGHPGKALLDDQRRVQVSIVEKTLKTRTDQVDSNTVYYGQALFGAEESDNVWFITRVTKNGNITLTDLASSGFDQVWDDRLTLTYN
jgi:hypothetical protein